MNIELTPPRSAQPLMAAIKKPRLTGQLCLADFPDLALAASVTKAELVSEGETFAAVMACLETLARLKLGVSSCLLMMLLVKHGPQSCVQLSTRMKISTAAITGLTTRLEMLALISVQRAAMPDRRTVMIGITESGRKVLASLLTLTDLGAAAAMLLGQRETSKSNSNTPRA